MAEVELLMAGLLHGGAEQQHAAENHEFS
jgi:hypothetical protein